MTLSSRDSTHLGLLLEASTSSKLSFEMYRSLSLPGPDRITSSVDISALEQWLVAFCTIRFDLEQGQVVEECYPAGALSLDEELDVAFSSFPDSISNTRSKAGLHDSVFFFRTRRRGTPPRNNPVIKRNISRSTSVLAFNSPHQQSGNAEEPRTENSNSNNNVPGKGAQKYLYGFVFNRQRHDEKLKRGGEQKSLVVLSEWPFYCVFKPLVQILGPYYFDMGALALEQAVLHISRWPKPEHGSLVELQFGKMLLKAHLPPLHTLPPGNGAVMDGFTCAMAPVLPSNRSVPQGIFHDVDLYGTFKGLLLHLWTLWELLLIGEPLLVISPTPSQCCEAVAALISLIAPLPCSVDFRPYFTIHDPDFSALNTWKEEDRIPSMILGVTNVFFLKALKMFPHVLSVGTAKGSSTVNPVAPRRKILTQSLHKQMQLVKRFSPTNLLTRREGPLCLMSEQREALWTSHIASTKVDVSVLNKLVDAKPSLCIEESTSMVNNETLRRHFLELTTNFLAPFGPYLRASTPPEGLSPFGPPPPLPPFDAHIFLDALATRGPGKFLSKRSNTNWLNLYRQFLEGPNFMPWFQRRRAVAEQEQHRLWRDACERIDIGAFVEKMNEVEIMDTFNAIESHIYREIQVSTAGGVDYKKSTSFSKMRSHLLSIFESLPADVQELLHLSPQRAALLQS